MENIIFKNLPVSKEILKAVEKMGFEEATPIQSQAIPHVLEGKDVVAQAPTGTGKTCAFGIPLIEMIDGSDSHIQSVILCPTRELVIQTTEELKNVAYFKKTIKILPIYGGQQIERQIIGLKKKPQIIVATPGRLMDHLRRKTVKIDNLKMVILDEADEMLNMGFREDIDTILETVPETKQMVLFSATLSKDILDIANTYQKDAVTVKVTHKEITVPTIKQYYIEVKGKKKVDVLTRLIDTNNFKLSLIFCNTKRMVDELTATLGSMGYTAEALHGDMKQLQRDRVMKRFRSGICDILIATDVAARGIDVDDIEAVFNYDLPNDEEYYVHRIGRTGRAKREGVSFTFVAGKEMYKLKEIMRYTKSTIKPFKSPTASDVEGIKIKKLFADVKEALKNNNISKYTNYIDQFIEEEESDITTLEIAAALIKLQFNDSLPTENPEKKEAFATGAESGMVRMFLNLGTLDKLRPRHVMELLTTHADIRSSQIGAIDIFDKYSFLEVPCECSEDVLSGINGISYKGRKVVIEKAQRSQKRGKK